MMKVSVWRGRGRVMAAVEDEGNDLIADTRCDSGSGGGEGRERGSVLGNVRVPHNRNRTGEGFVYFGVSNCGLEIEDNFMTAAVPHHKKKCLLILFIEA